MIWRRGLQQNQQGMWWKRWLEYPNHVQQAQLLNALGEKVSYLTEKIEDQATTILQGIEELLENRALEQGHITSAKLSELLQEYRAKTIEEIQQPIKELREELRDILMDKGMK